MSEEQKPIQSQHNVTMPGIVGEVEVTLSALGMVGNRLLHELTKLDPDTLEKTNQVVAFFTSVIGKIPAERQGFPILLAMIKLAAWGLEDFSNTIILKGAAACSQPTKSQVQLDPSVKKV